MSMRSGREQDSRMYLVTDGVPEQRQLARAFGIILLDVALRAVVLA